MNAVLRTIALIWLVCNPASAFAPSPSSVSHHRRLTTTRWSARKGVTLPLLDLSESDISDKVVVPLPSSHLPDELTTLNLYGMELSRPIHKMLIEEAIEKGKEVVEGGDKQRAFGHIVKKATDDSLVGAIGCSAEVLIQAAQSDAENESEVGMDAPIVVLYRGCYRFVVREVLKTIPYPVAVVDELVDDGDEDSSTLDDLDLEGYDTLDVGELNQRIMQGLKNLIDRKIDEAADVKVSPLEQSIVESSGMFLPDAPSQRDQAEEAAAVFGVFSSSLLDIAPTRPEQSYAIAMMAAEVAAFDNKKRAQVLSMTDGLKRLQLVCKTVEETLSMNQARRIASDITDTSEQDLQVGAPMLPEWASQIKKGMRVEYYWNEEYEWTAAEVLEDPVKIMDEYLIQLKFETDGEIHTLPLNPDEKVRWRPAR